MPETTSLKIRFALVTALLISIVTAIVETAITPGPDLQEGPVASVFAIVTWIVQETTNAF